MTAVCYIYRRSSTPRQCYRRADITHRYDGRIAIALDDTLQSDVRQNNKMRRFSVSIL